MKRDFKDYSIMKYYAKQMKARKGDITKDSIVSGIDYGETCFEFITIFEKKRSKLMDFSIEDVYEKYAKDKYATYKDFCDAFIKKYTFYDLVKIGDNYCIESRIDQNRVDHTASQAFTNISVMINCLNEILGKNEKSFGEDEIRDLHKSYLASEVKKSETLLSTGLACFILGIIVFIFDTVKLQNGFLLIISIFAILFGIFGIPSGFLKKKYYSHELTKARRSK